MKENNSSAFFPDTLFQAFKSVYQRLNFWQDQYPYRFSFSIALAITLFALFYHSSEFDVSDFGAYQPLQMVNVQTKSTKNSEISTEEGEEAQEDTEVAALESVAVDLSFYPNIDHPRSIVPMENNFPAIAREEDVEAKITYSLLIDEKGNVRKIEVIGIQLSKELPDEMKKKIEMEFYIAGMKNMQKARFTPPMIDGKRTAVIIDFPLVYTLKDN